MSIEFEQSHKRSHGRRTGDRYEEILLAYWCVRMILDRKILHVMHEVRDLEPADDIVVEFTTKIECYQAKHSTDQHGLISLEGLTTPASDGKPSLLHRLSEVWKELQSNDKSIEIHIYTNLAADPNLMKILDGNKIKAEVITQKRNDQHSRLMSSVNISSEDHKSDFFRSLRFNLRQPNVDQLINKIKKDWLNERLGLEPEEAYDRLMRHVGNWFREPKSRPIKREDVLGALQIDTTEIQQTFPVHWNEFIPWTSFQRKVIKILVLPLFQWVYRF
ncbi:MAG: hypothetical protein OXE59_04470 [Bacteroidetes bacterium]|nr:hypothetical protein [Bacteroidota bacterium]